MRLRGLPKSRLRSALALALAAAAFAGSCRVPPPGRGATTGEDLYRRNCALCHGVNGGGAQGPPIIDRQRPASEVATVVGSGAPGMPSFSEKLSDEEITAISEYVAELSRPRRAGRSEPEGLGG